VYVSVGVRFEANVEALNMVETVGNYGKHRRVPYIVAEEGGGFRTVYVPALSGESLAHAYQVLLVGEADAVYGGPGKAPVCAECRRGEFFKSMNKKHLEAKGIRVEAKGKKSVLKDSVSGEPVEKPADLERLIVERCLVEDLGGFLYAENPPVRRSSAFQFSYALPIKPAALHSVVEPQLHARHAQEIQSRAARREAGEEGASEQMIYYVETGTALYGFVFNVDLDAVGVSGITGEPLLGEEEVKRRRLAAMRALLRLLSSQQFGAKLSRFFPVGGVVGATVVVAEKPFTVSSPIYSGYVASTARRAGVVRGVFGEDIRVFVHEETEDLGGLKEDFVEEKGSVEEAVAAAIELLRSRGYV